MLIVFSPSSSVNPAYNSTMSHIGGGKCVMYIIHITQCTCIYVSESLIRSTQSQKRVVITRVCIVINETERFSTKPRRLLLLILAGLCLVTAIPQG